MIMTCRECGEEFDTSHPFHKGGYINVCGNCEDKLEDEKIKRKGITVITEDGDWDGIDVVDSQTFEKWKQIEECDIKNEFKRSKK